MTRFLIFQNNLGFSAWHAAVNTALDYPNALTRTDAYTAAIPHPDGGREACAVDGQCPAELLAGYTLYVEADLRAQGWEV